jgi:hypothetical protein
MWGFCAWIGHERRFERSFQPRRRISKTCRHARKAQLLAQLAYSEGEKYDPASDFPPELVQIGSDFSSAGLSRLINRNQRLNEARLVGQPILAAAAFQAASSAPSSPSL